MLPVLRKPSAKQEFQASEIKLYHPPRQLSSLDNHSQQNQLRRMSTHNNNNSMTSSSRIPAKNSKMKFNALKRGQTFSGVSTVQKGKQMHTPKKQSAGSNLPGYRQRDTNYEYGNMSIPQKMPNQSMLMGKRDLNAEIKLIEKKIRYHKKKLDEEKKKKQLQKQRKQDPYGEDFSKIVRKQMQMQGMVIEDDNKGFDYLTNPGKAKQQQEQGEVQEQPKPHQPPPVVHPKKYDLNEKIQKLQKHYQNNLKKKFQRREMFPHQQCKRKTPKLYITHQTNTLQKFGKKPAAAQHQFRIMTKQCTPQQIYPTIPNFAVVKDNLSRNVMAYLSDYKPFIEKTQQQGDQQDLETAEGNKTQGNEGYYDDADDKPQESHNARPDSNRRVIHNNQKRSGQMDLYQLKQDERNYEEKQQEHEHLKRA